ncbi:hypothetical protein HF1_05790 [Mycoplasma haemofelis str. Langford 1]|uniref:Uncharacterized protein n=1 Tax=Mycoplasma haemofelis (strain Langford 1) TaxID=941640 RepID=E8ZHG6_MYCHL|nr:hypothetical protein [Mycoplasma haemofelis]CBY92587.1 hypothetical protein HF1_05790 [Mycoplasma haemofelis str. Langford 1]
MPKIPVLGSFLTVGAGASLGGMALKESLSGNQERYSTVSLTRQEEDTLDSSLSEEELGVSRSQEGVVSTSDSPVVSSSEVVQPSVAPEESKAEKKCTVYSVKSTSEQSVRLEKDGFLEEIKDPQAKASATSTCAQRSKVYVANPSNSGWTYRQEDQDKQWVTIITDNQR